MHVVILQKEESNKSKDFSTDLHLIAFELILNYTFHEVL